ALNSAIDAENAAIFTYGVSTAFIGSGERRAVGDFVAAHRVRRDELIADLLAAGGTPPIAAAGYTLPVQITDPESATTVLLDAEEECARAYRAMAEQVDTAELRRRAVDGLTDSAVRAAHWRGALGQTPVTVAFPGAATSS
ncbi:MAG: ferritin-like domain-containing protein, partial [Gordonia sp. (in: high G+C Gram-positive bacteria)]|uniref:ferritin-like domain-containing protein n=1 Tax=Gordonia sp. (in: high G+C Gram-positive bacteria) TaxID=84139 RepID=UPI003BB6A1A4